MEEIPEGFTKIVTDFQQNARVLIDDHSKKAIIIDPGGDVESLYELANTKVFTQYIIIHITYVNMKLFFLKTFHAYGICKK